MRARRTVVPYLATLLRPNRPAPLAQCCICQGPLGSEEIVEGYEGRHDFVKVVGRCHGAEEIATFDMGSREWDDHELGRALARHKWFDPTLAET